MGGIGTGCVVGCGWGACVATGVEVAFGVGVMVGVGVTGVAVAVGAKVGTLVGVTWGVCPLAAEPHAVRAKTAMTMLQKMSTKRFLLEFPADENGLRNLRCRILFLIYLPGEKHI